MEEKQKNIDFHLPGTAFGSDPEEIIYPYVNRLIKQTESILDLDPGHSEDEIFKMVIQNAANFLEVDFANLWVLENGWNPLAFFSREGFFSGNGQDMPFEPSIAEEVVRTRQVYHIPNVWQEGRWKDKEALRKMAINSAFIIPVAIPCFSTKDIDQGGVLQLFSREPNKILSPLELEVAGMFSRRVSYVLARKRIKALQKYNAIRDRIGEHIFTRLARGEGIKMKDLFNSVIPELVEIIKVRRCALFAVKRDRREIVLEAGYPEWGHGIGKARTMDEPYAKLIVDQTGPFGEFEFEKVFPHFVLITDPSKSRLIPSDIKYFLATQQVHSVLYLPLKSDETINYFLAFDAQAQHKHFTDEEIKILVFLGMELMKGVRLERMYDLLHDSKNSAMALGGFVKRMQKILEEENYKENEKLSHAMEIILEESDRLQSLFFILFGEGREAPVDITEVLRKRLLYYRERMRELKRDNIRFEPPEWQEGLVVRCFPSSIERVMDNLLSNAFHAVPEEGGKVSIRTYQQDFWAVAEIGNSSQVREEEIKGYLYGEEERKGKTRGLHICKRLIRNMGGEIGVSAREGFVVFRVLLPLLAAGAKIGEGSSSTGQ